jgi:hypothetical protein
MSQANHDHTKDLRFKHGGGSSREILTGQAGTNLVLSKLQGWEIPAHPVMLGLLYDVVADIPHMGLIKVQVNTTAQVINKKCCFVMRPGFCYSMRGNFDYTDFDYDIAALVYLPMGKVCFHASPGSRAVFPPEWLLPVGIERKSLSFALNMLKCRRRSALDPNVESSGFQPCTAAKIQTSPERDQAHPTSITGEAKLARSKRR